MEAVFEALCVARATAHVHALSHFSSECGDYYGEDHMTETCSDHMNSYYLIYYN